MKGALASIALNRSSVRVMPKIYTELAMTVSAEVSSNVRLLSKTPRHQGRGDFSYEIIQIPFCVLSVFSTFSLNLHSFKS